MKVTNLLGDASKLALKSDSVNLIVTHPPYIGIDSERYGGESSSQINFSQNEKKMLKLLLKCVNEMYRVLKPGGSLVIANNSANGFDAKFMTEVIAKTRFNFKSYFPQIDDVESSVIVWQHYYKGNSPVMDFLNIKKHGSHYIGAPSNNIADPVDQALAQEGFHVLDVMNREVPEKFIKMFTFENDIVLDPFGGSGLVAVTAAKLGRIGITNDISEVQQMAVTRRVELSK